MKKTFYCVMTEFYDSGTVKAAMFSRECREKPKNSFRSVPKMDAHNDWFDTSKEAGAFLAKANCEI
jgi:hypothetical protein